MNTFGYFCCEAYKIISTNTTFPEKRNNFLDVNHNRINNAIQTNYKLSRSNSENLNCVGKPENVSNTAGQLQQEKLDDSRMDRDSSECKKYDDEDSGNDTSDINLDSDSDVSCDNGDCSDNDSDSVVGRSYHKGQHNQCKVTNSVQNLVKNNINSDVNGNVKKDSSTLENDFCSKNHMSSLSECISTNAPVDSDTYSCINNESGVICCYARSSVNDEATKHLVEVKAKALSCTDIDTVSHCKRTQEISSESLELTNSVNLLNAEISKAVPANAEHVNECKVYLVHPSSRLEHETGLIIETNLFNTGAKVIAKHHVKKVENPSIAQQLKLRTGQQLLEIQTIPTHSMDSQHLHSHFKCIDICEGIQLKVMQDKKIEIINFMIDITEESALVVSSSKIHNQKEHEKIGGNNETNLLALCDDANCSNCELRGDITDIITDQICDIEEDYEIVIAHQQSIELCSVMHNKTQMCLKTVDRQLVIDSLKKGDKSEQFNRKLMGGFKEGGESVIVIWFKETYPDRTAYISAIGQDKIGLVQPHKQGIVTIRQHATVLNSEDPRLFFHKHVGTRYSCFTSTLFEGQYLAVVNDQVKLKKVDEKDISTDEDIHFIINYQTDVKNTAQSSPKDNNVYEYVTTV